MQLTNILTISLSILSTITAATPLLALDSNSTHLARSPKAPKVYKGITYCSDLNKCQWIRADDKNCHTLDMQYTQFYPDKGLMCNLYANIECKGKFGTMKGKLYDVDYNIPDIGQNYDAVRNGVGGYQSFLC